MSNDAYDAKVRCFYDAQKELRSELPEKGWKTITQPMITHRAAKIGRVPDETMERFLLNEMQNSDRAKLGYPPRKHLPLKTRKKLSGRRLETTTDSFWYIQ